MLRPNKFKIHHLTFIILMAFAADGRLSAQDPQFSQFYAAFLHLNPAFAGANNRGRAEVNYRNQWSALRHSFTTISAYADYFSKRMAGGFQSVRCRRAVLFSTPGHWRMISPDTASKHQKIIPKRIHHSAFGLGTE